LDTAYIGMDRISKTSSTLVGALAWVLFAAGVRTALQADLLAAAGGDGVALGRDWLWGADVGFDSDFLGHGGLRVKNGVAPDFKPLRHGGPGGA